METPKKIDIKNDFSLRGITENDYIMQRNGVDMVCPIVPPQKMQQPVPPNAPVGTKPTVVSTRTSCSSMCPMFELGNEEGGVLTASVSCGCKEIKRNISSVKSAAEFAAEVAAQRMAANPTMNKVN